MLLGAGTFPQGDVVHSHLAHSASAALPLQDHLVNSRNVCAVSVTWSPLQTPKSPATLTLSSPVPHSVIWVCLQPFPPVRPHTAGLCCFPFFTNTCSMPTWWPANLCRNDRHRLPSFQGGVSGRTSWAPRPVLLLPTSGMVRYRPPVVMETGVNIWEEQPRSSGLKFSEETRGGSSAPFQNSRRAFGGCWDTNRFFHDCLTSISTNFTGISNSFL